MSRHRLIFEYMHVKPIAFDQFSHFEVALFSHMLRIEPITLLLRAEQSLWKKCGKRFDLCVCVHSPLSMPDLSFKECVFAVEHRPVSNLIAELFKALLWKKKLTFEKINKQYSIVNHKLHESFLVFQVNFVNLHCEWVKITLQESQLANSEVIDSTIDNFIKRNIEG